MQITDHKIDLPDRWIHDVLNRLPIGIVIVCRDQYKVLYANVFALNFGNKRKMFVPGSSLVDYLNSCNLFYPDGQRCCIAEHPVVKALLLNECVEGLCLREQWEEDEEQWMQVAAFPLEKQQNGKMAAMIFSDVSESMCQISRLKEQGNIKNKLLRILAHDLRSPFGGLLFLSEMLIEHKQNEEMLEKYIPLIKRSIKQVYETTSGMLEWALNYQVAIEPRFREVAVCALIDGILEELDFLCRAKDIRIRKLVPKGLCVSCDVNMIGSVIRNLISNAIKFSNNEGVIDLSVKQSGILTQFMIQDYGVGLSRQEVKRFNSSHTLTSRRGTNGEEGSGIGLLICKDFVAAHLGKLAVDSEPGKGATFVFCIPSGV